MLTKLEYLRLAIASNKIEDKTWYFSCFAIPILKQESDWATKCKQFDIVTQLDGLYYVETGVGGELILEKISDYVKDEPLYRFQDMVTIDPSWGPFITSKTETKLGVLIVNALILYPAFKNKLGYINETIKIGNIEKLLAERVVSDKDAKETDITVTEMIKCFDRLVS